MTEIWKTKVFLRSSVQILHPIRDTFCWILHGLHYDICDFKSIVNAIALYLSSCCAKANSLTSLFFPLWLCMDLTCSAQGSGIRGCDNALLVYPNLILKPLNRAWTHSRPPSQVDLAPCSHCEIPPLTAALETAVVCILICNESLWAVYILITGVYRLINPLNFMCR